MQKKHVNVLPILIASYGPRTFEGTLMQTSIHIITIITNITILDITLNGYSNRTEVSRRFPLNMSDYMSKFYVFQPKW
uniref:7TM GPCR serpentine receptor class x (Srx) domain-containing protein n=1 Tax=Parascaris univalens TaxID=6257 RepID=A0A915A4X8_PARUN